MLGLSHSSGQEGTGAQGPFSIRIECVTCVYACVSVCIAYLYLA